MPTTVFIVDDEKNIRRTVRMVLEGEGYTVEEAASGEEALARLPEVDADIVLLDVQLPGLSGHDVLEGMRKLALADQEPDGRHDLRPRHAERRGAGDQGGGLRLPGEAARPRAADGHPAQRASSGGRWRARWRACAR